MSRSLHTQKLDVRAQRRLTRPYSKRKTEAEYLSGRSGTNETALIFRLPVTVQKPLPGMHHPLTLGDIHALFKILGPAAIYGLKSICLRQESALRREGVVFAEYAVNGEINLYALPESPWRLPYLLAAEDTAAFERYGGYVETDLEREQTSVHWSVDGLKRFALYEVLAHELGHHQLQRDRGKRRTTICRRSDHEKRADLQSRRVLKIAHRSEGLR